MDLPALIERLETALETFGNTATKDQVAAVHKTLLQHSDALFKSVNVDAIKFSEFSLVKSVLEEKLDEHAAALTAKLAAHADTAANVLPDGEIVGDGRYEVLDTGWVEAFIAWLENYFTPLDFPQPGVWLQIPDKASFAIFGDWGGGCWVGNNVAETIANRIKSLNPDYSIHLGDVYYAGEPEQARDFLLDLWPVAKNGNFTLNSNHEMYPAGKGYFDVVLKDPRFRQQQGKSFFALENADWIIAGLDSAFAADKDDLYLQGAINDIQQDFLKAVAAKGKNVIVLCHHNPVDLTGVDKNTLWGQVHDILGDTLTYWYWGHAHAGAVYSDIDNVKCRLAGHGVIPWGNSLSLQKSLGASVEWYEHESPNPPDGARVQNGFALLKLNGPNVDEKFYGEDGLIHWL